MKKSCHGFTIVELLVTTTISVLLIATLMTVLMLGRDVWQDAETKIGTMSEVRRGLTEVALDLPRTSWKTVADGGPPQAITLSGDGSSITFQIPQSTEGGAVVWGDVLRYRVGGRGNQLVRENLTTAETRVIANFVERVTFGRLSNPHENVITATLRAQKRSLSTRVFESTLTTNFYVRN